MTPPRAPSERRRFTITRRGCLSALLCASAGLALAGRARQAAAQGFNWEHIINLAGRQRMLSQRMSKEVALIALQYNARENLRNLQVSSEEFDRVLKGLRGGDIDLALPPTADPTILDDLSRVEELWPVFKSQVGSVVASGAATINEVAIVAETNLPLLRAMDDTVKAYEAVARAGQASSMLAVAVNLAGAQRMLSQKMSKELYLIALDHDAAANRRSLAQSAERFDRVLNGLISGDNELLLLPAPAGQVREQLGTVQRLWQEFQPIVLAVANGRPVDSDTIAETASLNLTLLAEMNTAVGQYVALRPQSRSDIQPAGGGGARLDDLPIA